MRATARLVLQYFLMFPTQRRLLEAAGALIVIAGIIEVGGGGGAYLAGLAALLLLVPLFATIGIVFRTLAAPRTHRLLPTFRPRLLAATALVVAFGAGVAGAFVNALESLGFMPYVYAAGALGMTLCLTAIEPRLVASWLVLCHLLEQAATKRSTQTVDRSEAFAAYLAGGIGRPARRWARTALALGPALVLVALIAKLPGGARASLGLPFLLALIVPIEAYSGAVRAKLLWLRSGCGRSELFAMLERDLAKTQLATALLLGFVPPAIAALFVPVPASAFAAVPVCVAAIAVAGSYLALSIRSLGSLEMIVSAIYLLGVGVAGFAALLEPMRIDMLLQIAAALSAGALVLRHVAVRRWRNVDWLELRMPTVRRAS